MHFCCYSVCDDVQPLRWICVDSCFNLKIGAFFVCMKNLNIWTIESSNWSTYILIVNMFMRKIHRKTGGVLASMVNIARRSMAYYPIEESIFGLTEEQQQVIHKI